MKNITFSFITSCLCQTTTYVELNINSVMWSLDLCEVVLVPFLIFP